MLFYRNIYEVHKQRWYAKPRTYSNRKPKKEPRRPPLDPDRAQIWATFAAKMIGQPDANKKRLGHRCFDWLSLRI